jgi:hypothetical protein
MNKRRIISRLIVSPIILVLLIVSYGIGCIKHFVRFIKYGGEWLSYTKNDAKRMDDIYKFLKENYDKNRMV